MFSRFFFKSFVSLTLLPAGEVLNRYTTLKLRVALLRWILLAIVCRRYRGLPHEAARQRSVVGEPEKLRLKKNMIAL